MRIRDAAVDRLAREFQAKTSTVSDRDVLQLLAELADGPGQSAAQRLEALNDPGLSRAQQLELVKAGLDGDELHDVHALLDAGLALSPAAKNLLEALVGRAPLDPNAPGLVLEARAGQLSGLAMPGAVIEAVNLSTAAAGFGRITDGIELGRADERGRFSVFMGDAQQGDRLRVRARSASGASDWFTVTADTGQPDLRAAFVNLRRLLVRASPDGTLAIHSASSTLPFTEPHATVRFKNERTGAAVDVKMGDHATLLSPVVLHGQPGDVISVAVSDGAGNTDFAFVAGTKTAPGFPPRGAVDDPPVAPGGPASFARAEGDLFVDGPSGTDPKQGQLGNCYVPAGLAAVAHADPKAIEELIRPNGDGSYTVRFFDAQTLEAQEVVVDRELPGGPDRPRYGTSTQRDANGRTETWVSLVEKAYATWKGGYDVVARGGSVGAMQTNVLGRPNTEHWLSGAAVEQVFATLQRGRANGRAMAAGTYGTNESSRYTGTGLYANHAYSVLEAREVDGRKLVTVRNPWATGEPGRDGVDHGVFELPVEEFVRLFQVLNVC